MKNVFLLVILFIYVFVLFSNNYVFVYCITIGILFYLIKFYSSFLTKVLAVFFIVYFGFSTLNISSYRGTITVETLKLFSLFIFLLIIPSIQTGRNISLYSSRNLNIDKGFGLLVTFHLVFVYIGLAYIILSYGNVLVYQSLRFKISPLLGYIVKSSLVIPLFYPFKNSKHRFDKFKFLLLPFLPSIFIGSRGNVVVIIISLVVIYYIKNKQDVIGFISKQVSFKRGAYLAGSLIVILIVSLFFVRRIFSGGELLSPTEILTVYDFPSDNIGYLLILPFYTAFRETIGISNIIIENDFSNTYSEIPLFFLELFTPLPGFDRAPGQILGNDILSSKLDGGLTPGILGGLYLDFGVYSVLFGILFSFLLVMLYKRSLTSYYYLILFSLTITQFFHLFHRGFLKLEYFTYYIIIFCYFIYIRVKWNN